MKLIPDAHNWSRFWSVRLSILSGAFSAVVAAYVTLPPDWLPALPAAFKQALAIGALATAFGAALARGVAQPALGQSTAGDPK